MGAGMPPGCVHVAVLLAVLHSWLLPTPGAMADHVIVWPARAKADGSDHRHECSPGEHQLYRRRNLHTSLIASPLIPSEESFYNAAESPRLPNRRLQAIHAPLNIKKVDLAPIFIVGGRSESASIAAHEVANRLKTQVTNGQVEVVDSVSDIGLEDKIDWEVPPPAAPKPTIPLYWIGLGDNDRAKSMEREKARHQWDDSSFIHVQAVDGRAGFGALKKLLRTPSSSIHAGIENNISHVPCAGRWCLPTEIATILSHIRAVRQAYASGHDMVLIAEDDVDLSLYDESIVRGIVEKNLQNTEWSSLQLTSLNKVALDELFRLPVGAVPTHYATNHLRGYALKLYSRQGMRNILDVAGYTGDTFYIPRKHDATRHGKESTCRDLQTRIKNQIIKEKHAYKSDRSTSLRTPWRPTTPCSLFERIFNADNILHSWELHPYVSTRPFATTHLSPSTIDNLDTKSFESDLLIQSWADQLPGAAYRLRYGTISDISRTASHMKAIHRAYHAGHDSVIVAEVSGARHFDYGNVDWSHVAESIREAKTFVEATPDGNHGVSGYTIQLRTSSPHLWEKSQLLVKRGCPTLVPRHEELHGGADLYAVVGRSAMHEFARLWHDGDDKIISIPKHTSFVPDVFIFRRPSMKSYFAPRAQLESSESNIPLKQLPLLIAARHIMHRSILREAYIHRRILNHSRSLDCQACPIGYASSVYDAIECEKCGQGKYQDESESRQCKVCDRGTYLEEPSNDTASTHGCKICAKGMYQPNEGEGSCLPCESGKHNSFDALNFNGDLAAAHSNCYHCAVGKYSDMEGQENCEPCEPGKKGVEAGATSCQICEAGFYSSNSGSHMCSSCPEGFYQMNSSSQSCSLCLAGKFTQFESQIECKLCPYGFFLPENMRFEGAKCMECGSCDGSCMTKLGQTMCAGECPPGSYGTSAQATANNCSICTPGKYSTGGADAANCLDCSPGRFSVSGGSGYCEKCRAGTWNNVTAAISASLCRECSKGKYSTLRASATEESCKDCSLGMYQLETGANSPLFCKYCPQGFTGLGMHPGLGCEPCPSGYVSGSSGSSIACSECQIGQFQNLNHQAACFLCGMGMFQNEKSSTSCKECPSGYFIESSPSTYCKTCPIGWMQEFNRSVSCVKCMPGFFNDHRASSNCTSCPMSWFQPESAKSFCALIKPGHIGNVARTSQMKVPHGFRATQCMPNKPEDSDQTTFCTDMEPCKAGTRGDPSASTKCTLCEKGKYSYGSSLTCNSCDRGKYAHNYADIWDCHLCPSGWFQDGMGSHDCSICPYGWAQPSEGSQACIDLGVPSPEKCSVEREYLDTGSSYFNWTTWKCRQCPEGALCGRKSTADFINTMGVKEGFWVTSPEYVHASNYTDALLVLTLNHDHRSTHKSVFQTCPFALNCNVKTRNSSQLQIQTTSQCSRGVNENYPLCAVCMHGWRRAPNGTCELCKETSERFETFVIPIITVSIIIIAILLRQCSKRISRVSKDAFFEVCRGMAIMVTFTQVSTSSATIFLDVDFGLDLREYLNHLNFVNLDFVDISGVACDVTISQKSKIYFAASIVIVLILAPLFTYSCLMHKLHSKLRSQPDKRWIRENWMKSLLEAFEVIDVDCSGEMDTIELLYFVKLVEGRRKAGSGKTVVMQSPRSKLPMPMTEKKRGSYNTLLCHFQNDKKMALKKFLLVMDNHYESRNDCKLSLIKWRLKNEAIRFSTCFIAQLAFLLHSPISRTIFQWFNCRKLVDSSFVQADFSIQCGTIEYYSFLVIVLPLIFLFCLGLPFGVAVVIFINRKTLQTSHTRSRLGWLYSRYNRGSEWWDIHELIRKLLLCCLLIFIDDRLVRFAAAITISALSLVTLNLLRPYKNKLVFTISELAFLGTCLRYVATLALLVNDHNLNRIYSYIIAVDLTVASFALFAFIGIFFNVYKNTRREWVRKEREIAKRMENELLNTKSQTRSSSSLREISSKDHHAVVDL